MTLSLLLACAASKDPAPAVATESAGAETVPEPQYLTPYGFWGLNGFTSEAALSDLRGRLHMTLVQTATTDPTYALRQLFPMARASGVKITLRMTGDHEHYTLEGSFNLELWQKRLDLWDGADLSAYIADGTFAGHMLVDDVLNWPGADPTGEELEAMASYSQAKFPGLPTFVRERASRIPVPTSGRFTVVDGCVNQYKAKDGDLQTFIEDDRSAAERLGLGTINGMNIADGGDGSSGQPGWTDGKWAMSAAEITEYGTALAAVPELSMFLNWEYDAEEPWSDGTLGAEYFARPELESALADLGRLVGEHPAVALRP